MKEVSTTRTRYAGTSYCLTFKECEKLSKIYIDNKLYETISDHFRILSIGYAVCRDSL